MNNLSKIIITLTAVTSMAHALTDQEIEAERLAWSKAYLAKEHGIEPDGGVKVMPEKEMRTYSHGERYLMHRDIQKYGYINKPNDLNNRLFDLAYIARRDLRAHANDSSPYSTHLRSNIADIKMAYKFEGIPAGLVNVLGYAPYLTYQKDKGWVGAMEFFTKDGLGNCSYSENNIKLSHAAAIIPKEDVTYVVNGKVTTAIAQGTPESKFIYTVDWYDDKFFKQIACANESYDSAITQGIIDLAKVADKESATP